jgi:integrase/recombinase XerD
LIRAVESYLGVRRAAGFALTKEGRYLKNFAAFSEARKQRYVSTETAVEWAGLARSVPQRARRLRSVIRFASYLRAEDKRHEVPPAVFGSARVPRPTPYILTEKQIRQLVTAASQSRYRICGATYSALFSLLACTGLRVSEAIHLQLDDVTPDGLVIRRTKFRKSRLVPLHETAQAGLERYLQQRRPYAPFDNHVFVSVQGKSPSPTAVDKAFRAAVKRARLPLGPEGVRPRPHSLRHTFAVRALQTCPDGRDTITKHMLALSTYLGHSKVAHTYWYLEAVPELMRDIADCAEQFAMRRGQEHDSKLRQHATEENRSRSMSWNRQETPVRSGAGTCQSKVPRRIS